jgi:hypothetical protein
LNDVFDATGFFTMAVTIRASLAGAAIDGEMMLEISKFAIGLTVVTQGRSTSGDCFAQNFLNGLM